MTSAPIQDTSLVQAIQQLTAAIVGRRIYMAFRLGKVTEQASRPDPTPEFASSLKGVVLSMSEMTGSQQVRMSVVFKDAAGNPARVDDIPQWLVDNPNVVALEPEPDGMACLAKAVGPLGGADITLQADADLGEGVVHIIGTHHFDITAGQATTVEIIVGTPTEQS